MGSSSASASTTTTRAWVTTTTCRRSRRSRALRMRPLRWRRWTECRCILLALPFLCSFCFSVEEAVPCTSSVLPDFSHRISALATGLWPDSYQGVARRPCGVPRQAHKDRSRDARTRAAKENNVTDLLLHVPAALLIG